MRNRIMSLPALIGVVGLAMVAGGSGSSTSFSRIAGSQAAQGHFAFVYKAAGQDLLKNGPRPEDMPVLQAHVKYMRTLAEQGTSVFAGHTLNHDETSFGLLVVKADSEASARKIMEADPIVHAGLVQGTVIPFGVATIGKDVTALK